MELDCNQNQMFGYYDDKLTLVLCNMLIKYRYRDMRLHIVLDLGFHNMVVYSGCQVK